MQWISLTLGRLVVLLQLCYRLILCIPLGTSQPMAHRSSSHHSSASLNTSSRSTKSSYSGLMLSSREASIRSSYIVGPTSAPLLVCKINYSDQHSTNNHFNYHQHVGIYCWKRRLKITSAIFKQFLFYPTTDGRPSYDTPSDFRVPNSINHQVTTHHSEFRIPSSYNTSSEFQIPCRLIVVCWVWVESSHRKSKPGLL